MGFFDNVKNFFGGHGVKVQNLTIEQQDPAAVSLPIGDTVVKGKFKVTTEKPAQVVSMEAQFCMEVKHPDGRVEVAILGKDVFPEPNTSRSDDMVKYPYELTPGKEVEDFFSIMMEPNITDALKQRNMTVTQARFFVKTSVGLKGVLMDPETTNDIKIVVAP
jgi:hypothetical protein